MGEAEEEEDGRILAQFYLVQKWQNITELMEEILPDQ